MDAWKYQIYLSNCINGTMQMVYEIKHIVVDSIISIFSMLNKILLYKHKCYTEFLATEKNRI